MLMISPADVAADPFPHVIKQDILPQALFAQLKADFPRAQEFEAQRSVNGASGSRTGTGFDFYRGDASYVDLTTRSAAWKEFDAFVNSERFADTFREVFAAYIDDIGLRIDVMQSRVQPNYFEPRNSLTELATPADRVKTLGLNVVDLFQKPKPVQLFTRLDIHKSLGGYAKPPHCDRPNRLCSLIIYFTDAENAGLEGGDLLIFKHNQDKPVKNYERHPRAQDVTQIAKLRPQENLGVFFPCQNNSYHGVTAVTSRGVERDFLYINISGRTASLW